MTGVFYNENDPFAAAWLARLVDAAELPSGQVSAASIVDVRPEETAPVSHFFAGIGGWPLALRQAGWPDAAPVWTGSCPCQPFSVAGRRKGKDDARHLWPTWFELIPRVPPCSPLWRAGCVT